MPLTHISIDIDIHDFVFLTMPIIIQKKVCTMSIIIQFLSFFIAKKNKVSECHSLVLFVPCQMYPNFYLYFED
jgi:hypothetical protein